MVVGMCLYVFVCVGGCSAWEKEERRSERSGGR